MNLLRFALASLVFIPAAHAQSPGAMKVTPLPQPIAMPATPPRAVPPPVAMPVDKPVIAPTPVPGPKLVVAPSVVKKPVEGKTPIEVPVGPPVKKPGRGEGKPEWAGKPNLPGKPDGAGKPEWAGSPGKPRLTPLDDLAPQKEALADEKSQQDLNRLQEAMQQENQNYTSVSNVLKSKHDTQKNSISNVR
jgi:hypothetical protein